MMGEGRREWGMKAMMEGSDGRLMVGGTEDGMKARTGKSEGRRVGRRRAGEWKKNRIRRRCLRT